MSSPEKPRSLERGVVTDRLAPQHADGPSRNARLENLLGEWQVRLGLSDWTLRMEQVSFRRPWQSGDVKVDVVERTALILMSDTPFRDEEETLVHELVHVMLWPLDLVAMDLAEVVGPEGSPARAFAEAAVFRALEPVTEQLARALLRTKGHQPVAAWASLEDQARDRTDFFGSRRAEEDR